MWRETTQHPRNLKIWREEFEDFMPPKVLDFHVHLLNAETLPPGEKFSSAGHFVGKYDLDDLRHDMPLTYPGRDAYAVCFGFPNERYNQAANNAYVASVCDGKRFFPFRLIDPAEDTAAVRRDVIEKGFLGFKPYLNYVRNVPVGDIEVRHMLPDAVMQIADDLGLIVMLHIPRKERLADPVNQRQVIELCRQFPKAKIVLAHIGRAYYLKNIVGHLEKFLGLDNLWIDLTMIGNWEVLEHAFKVFPHGRILYGTDIPLALAPGKSVEINDQYTYVTPVPWELSISDDHKKLVFTSFLYEELRAIKKAVERLGLPRSFVEGVFFDNGMKLLQTVKPTRRENA